MIKVIAFDYAGVIAPGPMTDWAKKNLSRDSKDFKTYIENAHKWDLGEMSLEEVYKVISEITGMPKDLIWEEFYEKSIFNDSVVTIIKKLKSNYKVILFSNFIGELLRKLLSKYKIHDLFDEIIISSEHKLKKPHPDFFNILLQKSGVPKNEILFIDDRLENIEGAKKFGILAIHFKGSEKLIEDLKNLGINF
jgi:epoxide hydrolase-like predicted phosphatase